MTVYSGDAGRRHAVRRTALGIPSWCMGAVYWGVAGECLISNQ